MGLAAVSAGSGKRREALLSAQFLFRKQQAHFSQRFHQSLGELMVSEPGQKVAAAATKDWTELSLMDDDQVDALVAADRIGLAIGHHSEWELREVESLLAGLNLGERSPLRPELSAQALLTAVQIVSDDADTRQLLTDELTRALALELRACYRDIADLLLSRGLRPQDLRVRGSSNESGHGNAAPSTRAQSLQAGSGAAEFSTGHGGHSGHGGYGGQPSQRGGAGRATAGGLGHVDAQVMDLLRRLAQLPTANFGGGPSGFGGFSGFDDVHPHAQPGDYSHADQLPPNLIHQHRDELRQAATGRLDHMVIDVVGSLFDQILADPKVPPQLARQIARLQ